MRAPGTVPADVVRRIRRVFDARKATPSDADLAREHKLTVRLVRAIGRRDRYRDIAD